MPDARHVFLRSSSSSTYPPLFCFSSSLFYILRFVDPARKNYLRAPGANSDVAKRMTIHADGTNEDKWIYAR